MTIPTGFVKSTIQASGAPRRPTSSARSRTTGTVRKRLGEAARPGRLLADAAEPVGQRLVGQPGGLAADPELDEDERRPVDRGVAVGRRGQPAGPAAAAEDPLGQPGDDRQPLGIDVVEDELVDRQLVGPIGDALDELRACRCCLRR